jgi:chemotaxis regulatin CheY-phosphate phosphatase CheZ
MIFGRQKKAPVNTADAAPRAVAARPAAPPPAIVPHAPAPDTGAARAAADATRKTVAALRPACAEVLPSIALTITGIVQATEVAAQKVLDQADGLTADRDRLCEALARLRRFVVPTPEAQEACVSVVEAVHALSARIDPLIASMEFQDLSAQHLGAAIEAVQSLRERLVELLEDLGASAPRSQAPVRLAAKLGAAAGSSPWRQALADEIVNDRVSSDAVRTTA